MSHTPGPWEFAGHMRQGVHCLVTAQSGGRVIAKLLSQDEANARLIAAAPDLLAALIRLRDLDVNCSQQEDRAAWEQAHAAIARAEGK